MVDITLFEVHLDDASFSSSAPFVGGSEESSLGDREESALGDQEETERSGPNRLLVAFAGITLVAAVLWMARNGKPENLSMGEGELVEVEQ